ncbi:MAG TPA: hypothetical protein VGB32_05000 [Candidatus Bathyarchaeia archaeon]
MATRRDGSGIKRERLLKIHGMIKGAGDIPLGRFLATCSYTMGLNHSTTKKYLGDLVALDMIEVDEATDLVREHVPQAVNG